MKIVMVVAMSSNRVIGLNQGLPWRLSADLRNFKALTMGKPIVMGRLTYESIGRPLPGRTNIVVTRQKDYLAPGCVVVDSLQNAIVKAGTCEELMVIGGGQLYREALPVTQRIYLTWIHTEIDGDTLFEDLQLVDWREVSREDHSGDEKNQFDYSFVVLDRI